MADNVNSGITKKRSIGTMAPSSDMASDALRLGFQVSDQDAQTFLQQYPLDTIQQQLEHGAVPASSIGDFAGALQRVLNSQPGRDILAQSVPMANAALHAASPQLRKLGVEQLGKALQAGLQGDAELGSHTEDFANSLIQMLHDPDTGVASAAASALRSASSSVHGGELLMGPESRVLLQQVLQASDSHVRMRGLHLLMSAAAQRPGNVQALRSSGLLQPLQAELTNSADALSCSVALEFVEELAQGGPGSARVLAHALGAELTSLLTAPDVFLRCQAIRVTASVAAAASDDQQMPNGALMNGTVSHEHDISTESLVRALKPLLDPTADADVPATVEEAALDAVGRLGAGPVAASLFFEDAIELHRDVAALALGRAGSSERRIAALHALASVSSRRGGQGLSHLPAHAEACFRDAVFSASAAPAGSLLGFLRQPFPDMQIASFRLVEALSGRLWGAAECCREPELIEQLGRLDLAPEVQPFAHASLKALAQAVSSASQSAQGGQSATASALEAAAPRLQELLARNRHGRPRAEYRLDVATLP